MPLPQAAPEDLAAVKAWFRELAEQNQWRNVWPKRRWPSR